MPNVQVKKNYHKCLPKIGSDEQRYEISFLTGWCDASVFNLDFFRIECEEEEW